MTFLCMGHLGTKYQQLPKMERVTSLLCMVYCERQRKVTKRKKGAEIYAVNEIDRHTLKN
jgi:hypothetical protein